MRGGLISSAIKRVRYKQTHMVKSMCLGASALSLPSQIAHIRL